MGKGGHDLRGGMSRISSLCTYLDIGTLRLDGKSVFQGWQYGRILEDAMNIPLARIYRMWAWAEYGECLGCATLYG